MKFKTYINEVAGYTIKAKDKKIILAFINGDKKGQGKALWIEGDYLYGPNQSSTSDPVAMRNKKGKITVGNAYGNVSQTWINFIRKNTPKFFLETNLYERLTGPTRMQLQKELDKNRKTGMSIRKATMDIEKRYKVNLTVKNDGTIVNIE